MMRILLIYLASSFFNLFILLSSLWCSKRWTTGLYHCKVCISCARREAWLFWRSPDLFKTSLSADGISSSYLISTVAVLTSLFSLLFPLITICLSIASLWLLWKPRNAPSPLHFKHVFFIHIYISWENKSLGLIHDLLGAGRLLFS